MTKLLTLTAIIATGSWVGVEAYVAAAYLADWARELLAMSLAVL
ncbi:hypothetical protein [Methylocystis parvus]|jgi:hypothetical protein